MRLARKWEAAAAAQRARMGGTLRASLARVRRRDLDTGLGGLTQREIAVLLNLSERTVRRIERRAVGKLLKHPALRQVWSAYLAGELDESDWTLSSAKVQALRRLARTAEERQVIEKMVQMVEHEQCPPTTL
jgi:DNA-binding CsgD family transcriptional regulator